MEKVTQVQKRTLISFASISGKLNIRERDFVSMVVKDGAVIISPIGWHDKSQEYFWTDLWQNKMQESVSDLQECKFQMFETLGAVAKYAESLMRSDGE